MHIPSFWKLCWVVFVLDELNDKLLVIDGFNSAQDSDELDQSIQKTLYTNRLALVNSVF